MSKSSLGTPPNAWELTPEWVTPEWVLVVGTKGPEKNIEQTELSSVVRFVFRFVVCFVLLSVALGVFWVVLGVVFLVLVAVVACHYVYYH